MSDQVFELKLQYNIEIYTLNKYEYNVCKIIMATEDVWRNHGIKRDIQYGFLFLNLFLKQSLHTYFCREKKLQSI